MQVNEYPTKPNPGLISVADAMHALLIRRADELQGCPKGPVEEAELGSIADALTAYELLRWHKDKIPGGKG